MLGIFPRSVTPGQPSKGPMKAYEKILGIFPRSAVPTSTKRTMPAFSSGTLALHSSRYWSRTVARLIPNASLSIESLTRLPTQTIQMIASPPSSPAWGSASRTRQPSQAGPALNNESEGEVQQMLNKSIERRLNLSRS
jgi:hypothetical protein